MKPHVYLAQNLPVEVEDYIAKYCTYQKWDTDKPIPRAKLLAEIGEAEGLLTVGGRIDDELLDHAPKLRVVSNVSVGYNNFDLKAMKQRKIIGTNTPGVLDETVADLAFALMLAAARRIPELDHFVKAGLWTNTSDTSMFGVDVHGKRLGIIGMGRIGEAIARRARFGFLMDVIYYNRRRKPEAEERLGAEYRPLNQLLQEADFVVMVVPLTEETHHLMGREQFAMMKQTAIFVNVSRGKTVDEPALIEALQQKKILSAGLDVYDKEPVAVDNPLLQMPNVVTLPHIGSATAQTRFQMAMLAARNLVAGVTGKVPENIVPELREV